MPKLRAEICDSNRPVLLTQLGLLARYGQLNVVTALKNATDDGSGAARPVAACAERDSGPPKLDGSRSGVQHRAVGLDSSFLADRSQPFRLKAIR